MSALRPYFQRDGYLWGLGVEFYRFGIDSRNRNLTVRLGYHLLIWEWSR